MLTLSDINAATNSRDGSVFSDLFKDVYGYRPRGSIAQFNSIEEFDAEFDRLSVKLSEQLDEKRVRELHNFSKFVATIEEILTSKASSDMSYEDGVLHLVVQLNLVEDVCFYGYEVIEHQLNIPYGSIDKFLEEAV